MTFQSFDMLIQTINKHRLKHNSNVNIYVDTSNTISKENYMNIVDLIIQTFCKTFTLKSEIGYSEGKLYTTYLPNNDTLNIYSFTHFLSNKTELLPSLIHLKTNTNRVDADFLTYIYRDLFKPFGEANYRIAWDNITKTSHPDDVNIIITDFKYEPTDDDLQNMPANILYVAIEVSKENRDIIEQVTERFVHTVEPYDNDISNHIFVEHPITINKYVHIPRSKLKIKCSSNIENNTIYTLYRDSYMCNIGTDCEKEFYMYVPTNDKQNDPKNWEFHWCETDGDGDFDDILVELPTDDFEYIRNLYNQYTATH